MIRGTINQGDAVQSDKHGHPLGTFAVPQDWVGDKQEIRRLVDVADNLGLTPPSRRFASGATRDTDAGKLDFDGFLSPLTLRAYGEYMNRHRALPDGSQRPSDNWQLGIGQDVYMKSLWRHFFAVWEENKGIETPDGLVANLCAVLFNASGMLHEVLKAAQDQDEAAPRPMCRCSDFPFPLADPED